MTGAALVERHAVLRPRPRARQQQFTGGGSGPEHIPLRARSPSCRLTPAQQAGSLRCYTDQTQCLAVRLLARKARLAMRKLGTTVSPRLVAPSFHSPGEHDGRAASSASEMPAKQWRAIGHCSGAALATTAAIQPRKQKPCRPARAAIPSRRCRRQHQREPADEPPRSRADVRGALLERLGQAARQGRARSPAAIRHRPGGGGAVRPRGRRRRHRLSRPSTRTRKRRGARSRRKAGAAC